VAKTVLKPFMTRWTAAGSTCAWIGPVFRLISIGMALASMLVIAVPAARAIEVEFATRPVKRDILALFDSRHEGKPNNSRIHRLAEMPLNWLGLKVTFVDVNEALPSPEETARYRGVITWFNEPLKDPRKVLTWLDTVTANGVRYACLGEIAPPEPPGSDVYINRILGRLGLSSSDQYVNVTHKAKITTLDTGMAGFERPVDKALPSFRVILSSGTSAKVHLAALVPEAEGDITSVLIATSPAGGYAADAFTIFYDNAIDKARWVLNPFAFFKKAFGEDRFPVPDVTTLAGRRMYFSHIDGDGWNNISEIEGYKETQTSGSEVIFKEVIEPFPDMPVSVGLIGGDAVPGLGGTDDARVMAARIFAMPQVEVASHTYTHPFSWGFYESYSRDAETKLIENAGHPAISMMDHVRQFLYRVAGKTDEAEALTRYVAGGAELPRGYMKEPFDLNLEVKRALEISEQLAPAGKKAGIYLWSGDAEAFEGAIKATRDAGVRNMNGGDSRLDTEFPSVFYVPPISRTVGAQRQIYAANSNENTYTNNWHGPFYGQLLLAETLKNTELPRRLKPFNLYYHMYSGEKPGSLLAIKTFVAGAQKAKVIPVKASEYAAIADDFFAAEIHQIDAVSWTVEHRGNLQTLRLDDADAIDIDDAKSVGVLGATRHGGSLYVALDAAIEPAMIVTRVRDQAGPVFDRGVARLIDSRWQLQNVHKDACGFSFDAHGYGDGDMTWMTTPGQSFNVQASRNGSELAAAATVTADQSGKLEVPLKIIAIEPVQVRFECHEH
jgi:polysaccharide biosynthesis protein PelA